jgi:hypothetical protein
VEQLVRPSEKIEWRKNDTPEKSNQEATSRKKQKKQNEAAAVGVRAGLAVAWWSDSGVVVST